VRDQSITSATSESRKRKSFGCVLSHVGGIGGCHGERHGDADHRTHHTKMSWRTRNASSAVRRVLRRSGHRDRRRITPSRRRASNARPPTAASDRVEHRRGERSGRTRSNTGARRGPPAAGAARRGQCYRIAVAGTGKPAGGTESVSDAHIIVTRSAAMSSPCCGNTARMGVNPNLTCQSARTPAGQQNGVPWLRHAGGGPRALRAYVVGHREAGGCQRRGICARRGDSASRSGTSA